MAMTSAAHGHLLNDLSDEARAIVTSDARRLLVVAGAGTGKTEAMARRIAWWHARDGIPKDQIVAFTFTDQAADEMKFRIRKYIQAVEDPAADPSLGGMYVGTIHGYCLNTLRTLWPDDYHNDEVIDDVTRYSLVQEGYDFLLGLKQLEEALREQSPRPYFSRSKTIGYFLRAYDLLNEYDRLEVELCPDPRPEIGAEQEWCRRARLLTEVGEGAVAQAFAISAARYYAYLRCRHFLDFSTAQSELTRQLRSESGKHLELRMGTTHLVVDEVQDINPVQNEICRLLVDDQDGWLTAVGDHRQAIYGFRGGRIDIMAKLAAELEKDADGEVLDLTRNYRSTQRIIDISNRWNRTIGVPGKMSSPDMNHGRAGRVDRSPHHIGIIDLDGDRAREASWIAEKVCELVPSHEQGATHDSLDGRRGITYADVAVLVRSGTDARTYMQALQDAGIPAVVKAGPDLFAQPEILLFAAALSLSGGRDTFVGAHWKDRSLPSRLRDVLDVANADQPGAAQRAIRAAFNILSDEGLSIASDATDRVIKAACLMAQRLSDEAVNRVDYAELKTVELRKWLSGREPVRRVFPQTMLQWLMSEAGVSSWDVRNHRATTAMYHLGQLSTLVTGIETPGWTRAKSYKHQITSMLLWATESARPEEAPLLATPDAVTVTTIHSVKGLQYAAVFVADVCQSRFPSNQAKRKDPLPFKGELGSIIDPAHLADNDNYDDERRLLYVALTRAERFLYVSSSKPSKFFKELERIIDAEGGSVWRTLDEARRIPDLGVIASERSRETRLITSFSDLRYYLECPHDFYLRKVLGFTPTVDQAFGYGRGVHNLMRAVHSDPAHWAELARYPSALREEVQGLIDRGLFYLRHTTGEPAENMRRRGVEIVTDYVRTYAEELRRLTFEPEREFEVLVPGEDVLVSGAIDVVRLDEPPRVTIIDFKSGRRETDKHDALDEDEMRLQVSLYAVAARQELEYEPERGLVRYLAERDPSKKELEVPLDTETVEDSLTSVKSLAGGIQRREFRLGPRKTDKNGNPRCTTCDWLHICGLNSSSTRR